MNSESSCPICFEILKDKVKASPDNCEHVFCLQCLEKWSKLGSYCPVDRKRFKKIYNVDSETFIQIKSHKRKRKRTVFYDVTTHCEVCSDIKNAEVMLLCDCCDLGYHIHCLNPPLKEIPAGLWFCPTCIAVEEKLKKKNGITKQVEAELGGFNNTFLDKAKIKEKVTSYDEDSLPSSSSVKDKPSKGTSTNLIQFSVFQRIEGIDASQEICSQISSVDVPLSSNSPSQFCSVCNTELFARSKMKCKLCKLKYFNLKESKRFSNYEKNFQKGLDLQKHEKLNQNKVRFEFRGLRTQENVKKNSSAILERRKRSLLRTLKKIHDSKCSNMPSEN